jgi:hypothetical protein
LPLQRSWLRKIINEALYIARMELFYEYKREKFKETLRQKRKRLLHKDTEFDEDYEKLKVQFEMIHARILRIPFDEYWYPDYWLVFVCLYI